MMSQIILKQLKFLNSKRFLNDFLKSFLINFGGLWLFVESFSFFFPKQVDGDRTTLFLCVFAGALLLSGISSFPKSSHTRSFKKSNVEIEIKVGELIEEFHRGSHIVVGVNNRFSPTQNRKLNQSIKSEIASEFYDGRLDALDQAIVNSMPDIQLTGNADDGYKISIGDVAVISNDSRKIFFVINQEYEAGVLKDTSEKDLWLSLCNLWETVKYKGSSHPIAIPILGSGRGRAPASRISLIQLILLSFSIANRKVPITRRLTIVIRENDYTPEEVYEVIKFIENLDL